ncbi:response regulator [Spirosoma pollinicola]|uniref:Response regulator n=1 Tax=Spirosoma pollinicola TaxID=2057025 RepID=A0A2K8ZAP7_9BACT|nr:response regulator [Spirosoma pollinicola]AUD06952.1 response regulator [Spirosoma pollinicola]
MHQNTYPCVFIADDDEDDRFLLNLAFARHSPRCRLVFAHDGLALLDALSSSKTTPELIILDLNMPRLNGLEALKVLRHQPLYQTTPIVMLTTSEADYDRQQAEQLGANEFITKPMNSELLGQLVTQLRVNWLEGNCC